MTERQIPLFPLHAVLFPEGVLALRIFEPRYLDMICRCMKEGSGFGICLIQEGSETGKAAIAYEIGTLSEITYFQRLQGGLLGVTVSGVQRFRIKQREVLPNQLSMATVELIDNDPLLTLPEEYQGLAELLRDVIEQLDYPYIKLPKRYDDAAWVGSRLAELLPLNLEQKQYLLQLTDPLERLERLAALIESLAISY